jgi:hypothetical protein
MLAAQSRVFLRALVAGAAGLLCLTALAAEPNGIAPSAPAPSAAGRPAGSSPGALANLREATEAENELDRMVGQMILVGFLGASDGDTNVARVHDELARGIIGGVILFPDNIRSPARLRALTSYLANANKELTPFIAIDQEGGLVQRLSRRNGHAYFPAAK